MASWSLKHNWWGDKFDGKNGMNRDGENKTRYKKEGKNETKYKMGVRRIRH